MLTKNQILREVAKTSSSLTDEEIFSSKQFEELLQATVTAMCHKFHRIPKVYANCSSNSDMTACTDNLSIATNTMSPLVRDLETRYDRYVANIGQIGHEALHCLATSFNVLNPLRQNWLSGNDVFYPCVPDVAGAEDLKNYLVTHPYVRKIYAQIMCDICNILEDAYIENRGYAFYGGLVTAGLDKVNSEIHRRSISDKAVIERIFAGKLFPIHLAVYKMQGIKTGYGIKTEELNDVEMAINLAVDSIMAQCDEIQQLLWENEGYNRALLFNRLFVKLFSLMPLPDENAQSKRNSKGKGESQKSTQGQQTGESDESNSQSEPQNNADSSVSSEPKDEPNNKSEQEETVEEDPQNSSGDTSQSTEKDWGDDENLSSRVNNSEGDYDNSKTEEMSESRKELNEQMGVSEEAKGNTEAVDTDESDSEKAEEGKTNANAMNNTQSFTDSEEEMLTRNIAQQMVEKKLDEEVLQKNKQTAQGIFDKNKIPLTDFSGYFFNKRASNKPLYESIVAEHDIRKKSANLQRKINAILDCREEESLENGYLFGSKFNAGSTYKRDGRYFSKVIEPDGKPDVVFSILVDESGSMSWNGKSINARKTAILLEDVLSNLNIPFSIIGHTSIGGDVMLYQYVDFDRVSRDDRYTLSGITDDYGNIDGAVITYAAERLLTRPEEEKVLIVISDGLPAGRSFYASDGKDDTKMAVNKYRKQGIKVFGAILDDYEDIVALYEEKYSFDCREAASLEKSLVKLIQRYVLMEH